MAMNKLYDFELIVRGESKEEAPSCFVTYRDAQGAQRTRAFPAIDLDRVLFHSGVDGELWFDVFSGIESDEGIGLEE